MTNTHHAFGPSSLWRRASCPGSYLAERHLPDVQSDDADEGTRIHAAIAAGDESDEVAAKALSWLRAKGLRVIETEKRVAASDLYHGTIDAVCHDDEGNTHVVDWKTGHLPIDPHSATWQLLAYATALYASCPNLPQETEVTAWIYEPRSGTEHVMTVGPKDRLLFSQQFLSVRRRSEGADGVIPDRVSGPWCKHCRALAICEEPQGQSISVASEIVPAAALEHRTAKDRERAIKQAVASWPADRIAELAPRLKLMEWAASALRARIRDCLEQDPSLEESFGYRLHETNGQRSADTSELFAAVSGTVSRDEFVAACKVSVPKVESAFVDALCADGETTKAQAKRAFAEITDGIVRQPRITKLEEVR